MMMMMMMMMITSIVLLAGEEGEHVLAVDLLDDLARLHERAHLADLGRHYLSNATCLIRPHLFYALFMVSRITTICKSIRNF